MKRKALPQTTLRLLLARSGGFCENPDCNIDLFKFFTNRTFVDVNEAARIISHGVTGPRANEGPRTNLDSPDNFLLLCPNCHSLIDKAPGNFPATQLHEWKRRHESKIVDLFSGFRVPTRSQLVRLIKPLILENRTVFETHGPTPARQRITISDDRDLWDRHCLETIIPNNRKLLQILTVNANLLRDDELNGLHTFRLHKESFELVKVTKVRNASTSMFPVEFFDRLIEGANA